MEIQPDDVPLTGAPVFSDVAAGAWYAEAVAYVTERGIMSGYEGGTFGPADQLSRAQLAQVLYNLAGNPAPETVAEADFADVPADAWCADAVYWARSQGIIAGYSDTVFGPGDCITREQLAVMLYRYAQSKGLGFTGLWAFQLDFTDASQVSAYAYEAVCWCCMHGIMSGSDGVLNPGGTASRAHVAAMLMRFCQNTGL